MSNPITLVILGGGTAGWMAANLLASQWPRERLRIRLIASSEQGTVGVGEGSTPFLRQFFQGLGICESEWMPACDATYKCGITFPDWSTIPGYQSYFHPFYSEVDAPAAPLFFQHCQQRRLGADLSVSPDPYFVTAQLAQLGKAPICHGGQTQGLDYGYHFDAAKLGAFLQHHGEKQGVECIDDTIMRVEQHPNGAIRQLHGKLNCYAGDFFIDCSGFQSRLLGETLAEPMLSFQHQLLCNRAVAISTQAPANILNSHTISAAAEHGWVWQIPLQSRMGNGYVYCDQFLSEEQAEQELSKYLLSQGTTLDKNAEFRHLRWRPGRRERHWVQNCVAIGLSQGFLEPLEAPMLNIIQQSCEAFSHFWRKGNFSNAFADQFNRQINQLFDGTRDYLQAHYALNTRSEAFWQASREQIELSPVLSHILKGWREQQNFEQSLQQVASHLVYYRTSWYCLLAGMGEFASATYTAAQQYQTQQTELWRQVHALASDCENHKSYLDRLCTPTPAPTMSMESVHYG